MKYFLFGEFNEEQWAESVKTYWDNFKVYKNSLPENFVNEYEKCGFHDYELIKLVMRRDGNYSNVLIKLASPEDDTQLTLEYKMVSSFHLVNTTEENYGVWLYSEIYPDESGFVHEIAFDGGMEMKFQFKNLIFSKTHC